MSWKNNYKCCKNILEFLIAICKYKNDGIEFN